MKKFFLKFFLLLPLSVIIIGTNYYTDPANLFSNSKIENKISKLIIAHKNFSGIDSFDERIMQKNIINSFEESPKIISLGSSRIMQIESNLFSDNTFFNHFVSGASLEDFIAIMGMYFDKGIKPEIVIIGLDPWLLNKNNGQTRWISLKEEYNNGLLRLGGKAKFTFNFPGWNKWSQLISLAYFQESFTYLIKRKKKMLETTDKPNETSSVIRFDGSRGLSKIERERTSEEVSKMANEYASEEPVYSLGDFNELDQELKTNFNLFILFLVGQNVKPIFVLAPYHPKAYKKIIKKYAVVAEAEAFYKKYAFDNGIDLVGSYNPDISNTDCSLFYDGMHLKVDFYRTILPDLILKNLKK
ncbi:MAG: DUF1574 family protein [Candidatus Wallbacteria bacterium]|nr:DUF1574 family protein [Candidatus Wallbacteria bacterium]